MEAVRLPRPRLSREGRTVTRARCWGDESVFRACPGRCVGPDRGGIVDIGLAEAV